MRELSEVEVSLLRDLVAEALEVPAESRGDFVNQRAGDNQKLERHALRLLRLAETDSDEFDSPVGQSAEHFVGEAFGIESIDHKVEGTRVGPYRLVRKIGEGGMAFVYLAERADGAFRQQVAVKVIKRGMDTDRVLSRFLHERQILAALNHYNIAALHDGGTTEDGRPYFVLEYVEGKPITAYCHEKGLGVQERLLLFEQVCEAVQHAHENLIVHRDLKPENVFVTREGQVKLLDFGISKVLSDDQVALTMTITGERPLTPAYAAPEQFLGTAVTVSADVYSLGVLLYELLTDRLPYDRQEWTYHNARLAICEKTPPRPSSILGLQGIGEHVTRKSSYLRKRRKELSGDLDTISLKALRKEPERRYKTVAALLEDVRRHRLGLPVRARPESLSYRVNKWVARNRVVSSVGLFFVFVLAGVVAYNLHRLKEERLRILNSAAAISDFGWEQFHRGRFAEADSLLGAALVVQSAIPNYRIKDRALTLRRLAFVKGATDDSRGAVELMTEAVKLDPDSALLPQDLQMLGWNLRQSGDTQAADSVSVVHDSLMDWSAYELNRSFVSSTRIRAYVDGISDLVINRNSFVWRHHWAGVPGEDGEWNPTERILPTFVDSVAWKPIWPEYESRCAGCWGPPWAARSDGQCQACYSDSYEAPSTIVPGALQSVVVRMISGSNPVTVGQWPLPHNDYTLILEFDDSRVYGADWYEVLLDIDDRTEAIDQKPLLVRKK